MAEKRVQELLGQMQKTLECSICLEMMTNPVSTSCGHQFCRFCLLKLFDRDHKATHALCPLCKKPVTKRSLMKREQLGEMVEGVRNLISAFQTDTGALFSPPRGPQPSLLPGTPEAIQGKAPTQARKQGRETRRNNVRRSTRNQPEESGTETLPLDADSLERIPTDKSVRDNSSSRRNLNKYKNKNPVKTESAITEAHQVELLKCIEEGVHHADSTDKENIVYTKDGSTKATVSKPETSEPPITQNKSKIVHTKKTGKRLETNLTDSLKKCDSINVPNDGPSEHPKVKEVITKGDKLVEKVKDATEKVEVENEDLPVLSGNSVAMDSETSSGPLFKTPLDPKEKKKSEKRLDDSEICKNESSKRKLRTRNKVCDYVESEKAESEDSVKLTQDSIAFNETAISRTYSRKDKDTFTKEKKSNRKVAEWLKNIPAAVVSSEAKEVKGCKKQNKQAKKNIKVLEEEEAMGNKMKHLAQKAQDKDKSLFFDEDDFNVVENVSDEELELIEEHVQVVSENEGEITSNGEKKEIKASKMNIETEISNAINDESAGIKTEQIEENKNSVSDPSSSGVELEKAAPVKRKRIFKSRTIPTVAIATDKDKQAEINENKEDTNKIDSKKEAPKSEQSEVSVDPYEFQSSQNTPNKITKKKAKSRQTKNLSVKTKLNKKVTEKKPEVNIVRDTDYDIQFEKKWDKNLQPDKTILKNRSADDLSKLAATLDQAESHDLLTCTQEAVDSIAEENRKVKLKDTNVKKGAPLQKKVRFTEPAISDFVEAGKIDIIGYRKAKEEFTAAQGTGSKKDVLEEEIPLGKNDVGKINDGKDNESPICKENIESESDDLSEDYRFHDDSSGTDDLDIEPTPEQFEAPNLEIQPEEIKSQLSQVGQDVVLETPLIPINKDSPNVIKETPAVLTGPKFTKPLPKLISRAKKLNTGKNTKDTEIGKNKALGEVEVNQEKDYAKQGKCIEGVDNNRETMKSASPNLAADSDETRSPDDDLNSVQDTCRTDNEIIKENNDKEASDAGLPEIISVSSQSTSTQDSESILMPKESVPTKKTSNKSNMESENDGQDVLRETEVEIERVGSGKSNVKELTDKKTLPDADHTVEEKMTKPKKKRKSFMLDETEESLDFGSLSETAASKVEDDSETICQAKRQRVNRLRKSPKGKQSIQLTGIKSHAQKSEVDENVSIHTAADKIDSPNVDIISDTIASHSSEFNSRKSGLAIETDNDMVDTNSTSRNKYVKETPNSDVGEAESLKDKKETKDGEKGEMSKGPSAPLPEHKDLQCRNLIETIDVIGETEISNIYDVSNSKLRNEIKTQNSEDIGKRTSKRKPSIDKMSQKSNQTLTQKSDIAEKNAVNDDIVKVRHLSGMLVSPQESLVLSNTRNSPEDIFKIGTEMPSLDLSPDVTVQPTNCSPSLDLGSLMTMETGDNLPLESLNQVPESIDELNILDKKANEENSQNLMTKSCLTPKDKIEQSIDSSPEDMKRKSNVKSVRGFAKKKRLSNISQNSQSAYDSMDSVISRTPSQSIVKSKAPVVEFISPKLRKLSGDSTSESKVDAKSVKKNVLEDGMKQIKPCSKLISDPLKQTPGLVNQRLDYSNQILGHSPHMKEENVLAKYSPRSGVKKHINHPVAEIHPEIIEMTNNSYVSEGKDDLMLSPNSLPDLDNEDKIGNKVNENDDEQEENTNFNESQHVKWRKSKTSPKLLLKSPDKASNVLVQKGKDEGDDSHMITTVPETMSASMAEDMDDDMVENEVTNVRNSPVVNEIETSMPSPESPDFTLDSSDDEEESVEKQALSVIDKFDKIVENSIESDEEGKGMRKKVTGNRKENQGGQKVSTVRDSVNNFSSKQIKGKPVESVDKDMYSCKLDSSPLSQGEMYLTGGSEPVILESDLDDNDDDKSDDDAEYEAVVRRKGVKKAIISDSSSDEEEDSRHMSVSSVSALSSQSDNLTTQERLSLEKEVERMAKEMEALKEQLRRSKETHHSKTSGNKRSPKPLTIEDSDEDMIEAADSDRGEDDLFMSQPTMCLEDLPYDGPQPTVGDLEDISEKITNNTEDNSNAQGNKPATVDITKYRMEETLNSDDVQERGMENLTGIDVEETVDPDDVLNTREVVEDLPANAEETVDPDQVMEVEESLSLPPSILTVPDSEPEPSQPEPSLPEPSETSRQALADLDTNIPLPPKLTPGKMRHIGIVVTGLSHQQIVQTKKLAALNDVKFFTKFNDQVTHVVVKPADEEDTICDRTLKFFQGISRGCWIVNFFWVVDSRQVGHLLPEGPYEIQGDTANNELHHGPKRARLSKDPLFKKFQFSLIGDNTYLSKDSMTDLIEHCGGTVLELSSLGQGHKKLLVISCTDIDGEEEEKQIVKKRSRDLYKGLGVVTLTREWILDCLTMYRIQPIKDYVITDCPKLKLPTI